MTDVVGRLWQDGESLAQAKQYHEALLNYQRAKTLLIKESAAMFDGAQQKDKKASKLLGDIMEKLQVGITKITNTLTSNHQLALGLSYGFSKTDVKKAYRKHALKYHPDKNTDCDTTSIFTVIQAAYETLSKSAPTVGIADYKGGQGASAGTTTKKPDAGPHSSRTSGSSSWKPSAKAPGVPEPALGADYLRSLLKKFGFPARSVDKFSYEELMMKYLACKAHMKAREAGDRSKPTFSGKARRQSSYAGDMESDDDDDSARYGEYDARKNNKPYVPRSDPGEPYSHNVPNLNPHYQEKKNRPKTQREMEDEEEELLYNRRPRGTAAADKGKEKEMEKSSKPTYASYGTYEASKERDRLNEFRRKLDSKYDADAFDYSDKGYQHKGKARVPSFGKGQGENPFNLPKQAPVGQNSFVYNKTPRGAAEGGKAPSARVPKASPRVRKDKDDLASNIAVMGVGDLKRLMESKGISHEGCVEKIDLVEKLSAYFGVNNGANSGPGNVGRSAAGAGAGAPKRSNSFNVKSTKDPKVVKESSKFEFDHKPTRQKSAAASGSAAGKGGADGYVPSNGVNSKRNLNSDKGGKAGGSLYDRDIPESQGKAGAKAGASARVGPSVLDPSNIPAPVNNGQGHFVISTEKLREMEERLLGKGRPAGGAKEGGGRPVATGIPVTATAPEAATVTEKPTVNAENSKPKPTAAASVEPPRAPVDRESNALFDRLERIIADNTDPIHARPANPVREDGWGLGLESDDDEDSFDRLLNPFYQKMGNPHPGFGQSVNKKEADAETERVDPKSADGLFLRATARTTDKDGVRVSVSYNMFDRSPPSKDAGAASAQATAPASQGVPSYYDSDDSDSTGFTSGSEPPPPQGDPHHQSPFVVPSMVDILNSTRTVGAGELESDEEEEINYTGTHVRVGIAMTDDPPEDVDVDRESSPGTVGSGTGMGGAGDSDDEERYAYEVVDEPMAPTGAAYSMGVGGFGDVDEPGDDDDDVIDELFLNNFKQSTSNSVNAANAKVSGIVSPDRGRVPGRNPGGYDLDMEKVELANVKATGTGSGYTRSPAATFAWPNK